MNTDNRRGRAVSLPDLFDDSLEIAFDDDFEDGFSLSDDELDDFLSTAAPAAAHSRSAVTREVEQPAPAEERPARNPRRLPLWAAFVIDAVLVGCSLLVFALFHHVIPQRNISTQPPVQLVTDTADGFVSPTDTVSQSDAVSETDVLPAPFTEEVISTETGYSSPNVAITMTTGRYENADYYIQDIQLRDISLFRTAFAEDTYGLWVVDFTPEIARQHNAICAINGD